MEDDKKLAFKIFLHRYLLLSVTVILGIIVYSLNATKSGLWYDESVEYYYSKVILGHVPGDFGMENMYDRISITLQPPLYNVLMYLWLKVFDSEFAFRFAGILVTMLGSVGCFFAIDEVLNDSKWGIIGTLFYIFTPEIIYYGLECAEYNLVLCFVAWSVYFFVRTLKQKDMKSLIGFFFFSCLAVYSQYGAAFIVIGMYFTLFIDFLVKKEFIGLKRLFFLSVITLIIAVVPLIVFFLAKQMSLQGSITVSHIPYFENGFLRAFLGGGKKTLLFMFGEKMGYGIAVMILICIFSLIKYPKTMLCPVLSLVITWVLYFFVVCCSIYGYNNWDPDSIGSMNLGGRYSLFMLPAIVVVLIIGVGLFSNWIISGQCKIRKIVLPIIILGTVIYCTSTIYWAGFKGWVKDDIREVVSSWYDLKAYNTNTLIHQWDDTLFNYYMTHDERYDSETDIFVDVADYWIRSAGYDEMSEKLGKMGYLEQKDFYYIAPNSGSYNTFVNVMEDSGYNIDTIYSGYSVFLYLTKR